MKWNEIKWSSCLLMFMFARVLVCSCLFVFVHVCSCLFMLVRVCWCSFAFMFVLVSSYLFVFLHVCSCSCLFMVMFVPVCSCLFVFVFVRVCSCSEDVSEGSYEGGSVCVLYRLWIRFWRRFWRRFVLNTGDSFSDMTCRFLKVDSQRQLSCEKFKVQGSVQGWIAFDGQCERTNRPPIARA